MASEFDQYASDYEAMQKDPLRHSFSKDGTFFFARKWLLIRSYLTSLGRDLSSMSWLDIGCGKGELLRLGRPEVASITGCDVSTAMLELCPDIASRPMTDPERLPFPDQSFDLLTAVCVYHHVAPDGRAALTREAARVLRPGGVFAIIEHNPLNPATRLIVRRLPMDRHAILLGSWETRRWLRAAGFVSLDTTYFLYLPEKLFRMFSGLETALKRFPLGGQYAVFARKQ
jgi:SAM-dependent methyltransferase